MGGLECEILTFLGKHEHGVEEIGVLVDESDDFIGGEGQEQPHLADVLDPPPGLAEDPHSGGEAAPMEFIEVEEFPEEQTHLHDDFITTKNSGILDLRTACHWIGVSQAGSKTRLFECVKKAHRDSLRRSAVEIANAEYEREAQVAVKIPRRRRLPSARALHNLIHIPYRDWSQLCISTKARGDYQHSVANPEAALERDRPTIQVDFYFCEGKDERKTVSEAKAILLLVDVWTRYTHVEPMEKKSARAVGEEIFRFAGMVGHVRTIELAGDNEHVLVAGMELCKSVRAKHGFPTTISLNKSYSKSKIGVAERTIQKLRNLQKTLVAQLEHEIQCKLPPGHPGLYSSAVHASWLYNRYHTHSTIKVTPFQAVHGRPYRGRTTCFGHKVFGLKPVATKSRCGSKGFGLVDMQQIKMSLQPRLRL